MDEHQASNQPNSTTQPILKVDPDINFFAMTNFRNQNRKFGIKLDDRRRHMYIVGKTGMGKTTILENMVLNDIYAGHGVGLVDPHGDFAEKIINYIPPHRINDVVYFNPADIDYPIGFNILETIRPEQKHLVASGLMGVFKKIWPDVWSARMEYILNNTILALIDFPGTTLLGINRMLADAEYRKRVVNNSKDPVVKAFWQTEFANYTEKFRTEAVSPIQNKIGQFLSASVIRNIVAQVKSRINIREIMDEKKIFIMNLSKGRIGEDNSRLLGGMLITRIQLAAMERVDIVEKERSDFFLYVDEFQNFATESFAGILSEARKYRLDLIMAHQYMEQLDETVLAAVIGNVGTTVTFRVGSSDAEILAKEFIPTFVEEDLVNLPKFHIYLKLMIDGVASRPFSALTLPPINIATDSTEKVVRVSRERYAVSREKIEDKIMRWSGMVAMTPEEAAAMEGEDEEERFGAAPSAGPKPAVPPVPSAAPRPAVKAPERSQPPTVRPPSAPAAVVPLQRPTPRPAMEVKPMTQQAPSSSQGFGGGGGQGGEERNRKRKRKKKGNLNPHDGQNVLLVNPEQRGISLSQLDRAPQQSPQPREFKPEQKPRDPILSQNQSSSVPAVPVVEKLEERTIAVAVPTTPQPAPAQPRPQPQSVPPTKPTAPSSPGDLDLGFIPSPPPLPKNIPSVPVPPPPPQTSGGVTAPVQPAAQPKSAAKTVQPGRVVRFDE